MMGAMGWMALSGFGDERPNVVIFFADDLGYGDVGYHGSLDIVTPHIDSIAGNGVRFSAGYGTAPVCGPSRAGLRTGIYQNRFGAEDNPGPYKRREEVEIGIPTGMQTLAERMKALGYATGMIGTSHTGNTPAFHPTASGYDAFFGFINGVFTVRCRRRMWTWNGSSTSRI
jgi:arylsulfatase A-like enzyme